MKVLLIEDSARLLRSLGQGLRKEGFVVDMASDGRAGLLDAETSDYDVVILDLMLPGMDGWTILQRLRAQGKNTPILILSAKDQVHHRTRGLNMGADDYLIKPFAFDELCARIRALIRRRYHMKDPCIRLGALMLNTAMRQAYIRSQHLALTRNEYALLECLALRRGHVHTRAPHQTSTPLFRDIALPDGRHGRLVQVTFVPRQDIDGIGAAQRADSERSIRDPMLFSQRAAVLLLARDRMHLNTLMQSLQFALGVTVLVLLAVLAALVGLALTIGLRPLDDIKRQVATLDALSLNSGIQVRTQTRELAPVVDQLNAMLRRLDAAFARERRFAHDVAHELRTPLAELRALADVAMRWPDDQRAVSEYFHDVQDITLQMERIVVALLALARCESGLQLPQRNRVNLRELVEMSWRTIAREAREKGLAFVCDVPSSLRIETDGDMLSVVLQNLFSNAVTYSPPHQQVRCTATLHAERVRLSISNRTDTLTPEDLPHLFERFWRKDPARTASHHAGLGLSVVKAFADVLDLEVDVSLEAHRLFHVTVSV